MLRLKAALTAEFCEVYFVTSLHTACGCGELSHVQRQASIPDNDRFTYRARSHVLTIQLVLLLACSTLPMASARIREALGIFFM